MSMEREQDQPQGQDAPRGGFLRRVQRARYWILACIALGGFGTLAGQWFRFEGDATQQVMWVYYLLPATLFAILLWWVFLAPARWKVRLGIVGVLAVVAGTLLGMYRVKDFTGDMIPIFERRWGGSAAQRAQEFWQSKPEVVVESNSPDTSSGPSIKLDISPNDWPQIGGQHRDGIASTTGIALDWDKRLPREMWKHPVGGGWSSFAVVGDYAFTLEQRDSDETAVCYDANTGEQKWTHADRGVKFTSSLGGIGPRSTPTVFDSRIYTVGATGVLNCLDAGTGRLIWTVQLLEVTGVKNRDWGMCGSPLVYDNVVVVTPGGPRASLDATDGTDKAILAYDRIKGTLVWSAGNYMAGYSSPILATLGGVRQIILFDGVGVGGYDAANGKELWRSPGWTNAFHNNIAQPLVTPTGDIFVSSGYSQGSMFLGVKQENGGWKATARWTAPNRFKLKFNSGVLRDGFVYGLDEGILSAIDLSSGKQGWKKGRYKYGQLLAVGERVIVISEDGDIVLVEVSPTSSREIAKYHALSGKCWNLPVLSRGRLYVRNGEEAACYDLRDTQTAAQ